MGGTPLSPDVLAYCSPLSFIVSISIVGDVSADSAPSSLIAGGGSSSAVFDRALFLIANGSSLFAVSGFLLSLITGGGCSSTVSDRLLSFVASSGPLSTVLGYSLSLFAGSISMSTISGGALLSFILSAGFWALLLTSIPSHTCCLFLPFSPLFHSFLPFLLIQFAHNLAPLTRKRLCNQGFIIQRPIVSIQQ